MARNLSLVHAQGPAATVEGFALANGYRPLPNDDLASVGQVAERPGDDADWARPVLAVIETGAGLVLAAQLIVSQSWAADLSERGGSATWATWQGSTGTYGFAHHRDGKVVRELTRRDHAVAHELGDPLPQEALLRWGRPEAEPDDEADLFALVEAVTNLGPAEVWLAQPARIYAPGAITEIALEKKKRRFLGRP